MTLRYSKVPRVKIVLKVEKVKKKTLKARVKLHLKIIFGGNPEVPVTVLS